MCFCFLSYGQKEGQRHDVRACCSSAPQVLTQHPAHRAGTGVPKSSSPEKWFPRGPLVPRGSPPQNTHSLRKSPQNTPGERADCSPEAPRVAPCDEGHHAIAAHSTPALPHSSRSGPGLLRTVTNTLKKSHPQMNHFCE